MKYYLVFTTEFNDGTKDSYSIYSYDTKNECLANFHKQLGGWMLKENVKHIFAEACSDDGTIYKVETYDEVVATEASDTAQS